MKLSSRNNSHGYYLITFVKSPSNFTVAQAVFVLLILLCTFSAKSLDVKFILNLGYQNYSLTTSCCAVVAQLGYCAQNLH